MPSPHQSALPRLDQIKLWLVTAILAQPGEAIADPGFDEQDWRAIDRCSRQHRLIPLLTSRLRSSRAAPAPPDWLDHAWSAALRKAAIRSLDRYAVTIEVVRVLRSAGIACAVLKGGALGAAYGNPALRPMRDIDVLVAPDHAAAAFDLLLGAGYVRRAEITGAGHVDYAAHKHLEALWSRSRRVAVEIHTALAEAPRGRREDDALLAIGDLLTGRRYVTLGNHTVPALGWSEAMLHLIVHAVYDHQLNNGPLVLTDCAALARDPDADWPRFWEIAERGGRAGGARLVFAMIETFAPQLPPGAFPAGPPTDPGLVQQSALLMLQDMEKADAQGGWDRLFALGSWRKRLRLIRRKTELRTQAAREHHRHHGESGNLMLAWRMVRALADPAQRRDVSRSRAVFGWLQDQN